MKAIIYVNLFVWNVLFMEFEHTIIKDCVIGYSDSKTPPFRKI